jgi:hypothetical protein
MKTAWPPMGSTMGTPKLLEELAEAADLADAVGEVRLVDDLAQALGEGLHVGAGHAAVGVEALEQDGGGLEALVQEVVAHGDEAAHRDHGVLLGAHDARVGVLAHLVDDLRHGLVGVAGLAGLDEVGVLGEAGGVEDDEQAVLVGDAADLADVLHRDGLAAAGVAGDGDQDVGDVAGAVLADDALQAGDVDVALERVEALGGAAGVDGAVDGAAAGELDVGLGRVEVRVAGHDHVLLDEHEVEDALAGAALVDRDGVAVAHGLADLALHLEEGARAGVGLVADHHAAELLDREAPVPLSVMRSM